MAIETYSALQASVASWLNRADLTDRIVDFITLAESRLNRIVRKRQAETDQPLVGVLNSRFIPLPATYSEALNLWVDFGAGRHPVERFIDPALLETIDTAGRPYQWTVDGTNIAFERPCDQTYAFTLRMIGKYALSDASPTNTLLTDYPDAYLFGALIEAGPFLRDDDLFQTFEARFQNAVAEINSKEGRSRSLQTLSTEAGQLTSRMGRRSFDITRGY